MSPTREHRMSSLRIGHGFDVHAFEDGDHLIIGGVRIPYQQAFRAHSDGDVLLHAIADALLGALALGDIGRHFPDTDERWRNADSRELLRQVMDLIRQRGYRCVNIDATLMAQSPRMAPHIPAMQACIEADLALTPGCVSVKATTTESLGFCGRGEGIAATVMVLLEATD